MIAGDIPETVALLEALAGRGVPLYALTNWSHETFHHARARFPWLGHFRDILVSGDVGIKKPDRRIFRLMLQRIGVEPAAVVFIDDVVGNVESARALGIEAVHYTSPAALRKSPSLRALLG
jgi:HAD superfamily hydrolase (TIGR01509 family)